MRTSFKVKRSKVNLDVASQSITFASFNIYFISPWAAIVKKYKKMNAVQIGPISEIYYNYSLIYYVQK